MKCLKRKYRSYLLPTNSISTGFILTIPHDVEDSAKGGDCIDSYSRETARVPLLSAKPRQWPNGIVIISTHNSTTEYEMRRRVLRGGGKPLCTRTSSLSTHFSPCWGINSNTLITLVILWTRSSCQYPLQLWRGELHTRSMPAAVTLAPKRSQNLSFSWNFPLYSFKNLISHFGCGVSSELMSAWLSTTIQRCTLYLPISDTETPD